MQNIDDIFALKLAEDSWNMIYTVKLWTALKLIVSSKSAFASAKRLLLSKLQTYRIF